MLGFLDTREQEHAYHLLTVYAHARRKAGTEQRKGAQDKGSNVQCRDVVNAVLRCASRCQTLISLFRAQTLSIWGCAI